MTIERPEPAPLLAAPGTVATELRGFEPALRLALQHHVRLRDACLAPGVDITAAVDDARRHMQPLGATPAGDATPVTHMRLIREAVADYGFLVEEARRPLVVVDVLASLAGTDLGRHGRSVTELVAEAAVCLRMDRNLVRGLSRGLVAARRRLPRAVTWAQEVSPTAELGRSMRHVDGSTAGAAVAGAAMLLDGTPPVGWTPAAAGGVLLQESPSTGGFLGTVVARHDPSAYLDDLATLLVASRLLPDEPILGAGADLVRALRAEADAHPCDPAAAHLSTLADVTARAAQTSSRRHWRSLVSRRTL